MWRFVVPLLFIVIINVKSLKIISDHNPIQHISNLVSDKNNKPLIVVVDTKPRSTDFDDLLINGQDGGLLEDDGSHQSHASDDAAYILYHLLRTTKNDDSSDPILEEAKETLRHALRSRCKKVEKCVVKCPPKKPSCPINCQQVFDNLNLCPPPKPKKKDNCRPKCGKTMPPKWFF